MKKILEKSIIIIDKWTKIHLAGLFVFNIILIIILLLRSAGYFSPFFQLTINSIFFFAFILGILLLEVRSRALFVITLIFWLLAAFLKFFQIQIWAERTTIYAFQTLVLGILMIFWESRLNSTSQR